MFPFQVDFLSETNFDYSKDNLDNLQANFDCPQSFVITDSLSNPQAILSTCKNQQRVHCREIFHKTKRKGQGGKSQHTAGARVLGERGKLTYN